MASSQKSLKYLNHVILFTQKLFRPLVLLKLISTLELSKKESHIFSNPFSTTFPPHYQQLWCFNLIRWTSLFLTFVCSHVRISWIELSTRIFIAWNFLQFSTALNWMCNEFRHEIFWYLVSLTWMCTFAVSGLARRENVSR